MECVKRARVRAVCGHAVIALGKWAVDVGRVTAAAGADSVVVNIDTPCGLVVATVLVDEAGKGAACSFVSGLCNVCMHVHECGCSSSVNTVWFLCMAQNKACVTWIGAAARVCTQAT